jgi:hypothetical protein
LAAEVKATQLAAEVKATQLAAAAATEKAEEALTRAVKVEAAQVPSAAGPARKAEEGCLHAARGVARETRAALCSARFSGGPLTWVAHALGPSCPRRG